MVQTVVRFKLDWWLVRWFQFFWTFLQCPSTVFDPVLVNKLQTALKYVILKRTFFPASIQKVNPKNMTALYFGTGKKKKRKAFKFKYFIFNYAFYMHLHGCLSLLGAFAYLLVSRKANKKHKKIVRTFVEHFKGAFESFMNTGNRFFSPEKRVY